jgi:hypothetical protein
MNLSLLPLQNDELFRVRCEGPVSTRGRQPGSDPLQALLGPRCYGHRILLNLENPQAIDTSGIAWLMRTHNAFADAGGMLVLYKVSPTVRDMLDFLHLSPLLCIAADEPGATLLAARECEPGDNGRPLLRLPSAI